MSDSSPTVSGADFLDDEAPQAPREDGNEGNRNEIDEVLLRALEDGIQPPVAAQPGKGSFDPPVCHSTRSRARNLGQPCPADAGGDKLAVAAAGGAGQGSAGAAGGITSRRQCSRFSTPPMRAHDFIEFFGR